MSKIKNGGLDHYGKVYSLNGIGGERVNQKPAVGSQILHDDTTAATFAPARTTMTATLHQVVKERRGNSSYIALF